MLKDIRRVFYLLQWKKNTGFKIYYQFCLSILNILNILLLLAISSVCNLVVILNKMFAYQIWKKNYPMLILNFFKVPIIFLIVVINKKHMSYWKPYFQSSTVIISAIVRKEIDFSEWISDPLQTQITSVREKKDCYYCVKYSWESYTWKTTHRSTSGWEDFSIWTSCIQLNNKTNKPWFLQKPLVCDIIGWSCPEKTTLQSRDKG